MQRPLLLSILALVVILVGCTSPRVSPDISIQLSQTAPAAKPADPAPSSIPVPLIDEEPAPATAVPVVAPPAAEAASPPEPVLPREPTADPLFGRGAPIVAVTPHLPADPEEPAEEAAEEAPASVTPEPMPAPPASPPAVEVAIAAPVAPQVPAAPVAPAPSASVPSVDPPEVSEDPQPAEKPARKWAHSLFSFIVAAAGIGFAIWKRFPSKEGQQHGENQDAAAGGAGGSGNSTLAGSIAAAGDPVAGPGGPRAPRDWRD